MAIAGLAQGAQKRLGACLPMAPGVVDRAVTQATSFHDHYTDTRRPSLYYTNKLKAG